MVEYLLGSYQVSERPACRVAGLNRVSENLPAVQPAPQRLGHNRDPLYPNCHDLKWLY
jgi:hypothetical protein